MYAIPLDKVRNAISAFEVDGEIRVSLLHVVLDEYEAMMRREEFDAVHGDEFDVEDENNPLTVEDAIVLEEQWADYDGDYPPTYPV